MQVHSPLLTLSLGLSLLGAACGQLPRTAATSAETAAGSPAAGEVRKVAFHAATLGVTKNAIVYLPPSYRTSTTKRFPVAYYLHGLSGTETDWASKGGIDAIADSLFAHGTPEMIIVLPDGDDGWYTTWTTQVPYETCADTVRVEVARRYCVAHQRYDTYVAHDVVGYIDSQYRTLADPRHRGIAGLSMGGYGALALALEFPDVFSAAASHSGVVSPLLLGPHPFADPPRYANTVDEVRPATGGFWARYQNFWGNDIERWRAADPAHLAAALQARGGPMPALFIDCGVDDGFVDQNRALHLELTRLQISHSYAEWPGAHTWRYWSTHVPESLTWMAKAIGS